MNGTGVFAKMFERAGHKVSSTTWLAPKIQSSADSLVWFPDDVNPPTIEQQDWLEDYLSVKPGRTVIYVGRDYNAEVTYWQKVLPTAPIDQQAEIQRRLNEALLEQQSARAMAAPTSDCDWFKLDPGFATATPTTVTTLEGDAEWLAGVDPAKAEIEVAGHLVPTADAETWLSSKGVPLISRLVVGNGQLIIVHNGSFLLNLPLINHEHRKLAAKLIAECGAPGKVIFVESDWGGPTIYPEDPDPSGDSDLAMFGIWPFNVILMHVSLAGLIYMAGRFWIFGTPKEEVETHRSDFGRHISALGELIEKTGDQGYAAARLAHYHHLTRRDLGSASRVKERPVRAIPIADPNPKSQIPNPSPPDPSSLQPPASSLTPS